MNLRNWLFNSDGILRAGWRFALFLVLYLLTGRVLDLFLVLVHFPDRAFTCSSLLLGYLADFAFVSAIAWRMSRIARKHFSSYGLPLLPDAGKLLAQGAPWPARTPAKVEA